MSVLYPQAIAYGFDALDLLGNLLGPLSLGSAGHNTG
jgi:hypothetical protein